MAVSIYEIEEDGVPYRVTEDTGTGLFIKEAISPIPSLYEPIDLITELQLAIAELAEAQEQMIMELQLALAELTGSIMGGGHDGENLS